MNQKLLLLISVNYMSTYLAYSIFPPYLPKLAKDDKGVDQQTVGLILSLWYIGYSIFAILMGHILIYTGRKNAILFGLLLLCFDFLLAALAGSIENKFWFVIAYWVVRFIHGSAQAFVQVTTYSIIATWFKDSIAKVVGIVEFSWGSGIALGPLIAEVLYNTGGFNLPLYVFSFVMLLLGVITFVFMDKSVEGPDQSLRTLQVSDDNSISINETQSESEVKEKISIFKLLKYKLFVFGLLGAFFNLILYALLEPILSNRLTRLGVEEKSLGQYFWIQPFIYSLVSVFVDSLILTRISKRACLIIGFMIFSLGFIITGPSVFLFFLDPSLPLICFGLFLLGIGWALSFVPIFPEMIESVYFDFEDNIEDLNNTVASLMNASYGSAAIGQL